jgi:hypothetical protein
VLTERKQAVKAKRAEACVVLVIFLSAVWLLLADSAIANPGGQMLPWEYAPKITINSDGSRNNFTLKIP